MILIDFPWKLVLLLLWILSSLFHFLFNLKRFKYFLIFAWLASGYADFLDQKEETGKLYFGQFHTREIFSVETEYYGGCFSRSVIEGGITPQLMVFGQQPQRADVL